MASCLQSSRSCNRQWLSAAVRGALDVSVTDTQSKATGFFRQTSLLRTPLQFLDPARDFCIGSDVTGRVLIAAVGRNRRESPPAACETESAVALLEFIPFGFGFGPQILLPLPALFPPQFFL